MQNPENAIIGALHSAKPRPELADQLNLFGQFVGSWDVEIHNYFKPEGEHIVQGEWHFGWALDGRAIQDVWIAPSRAVCAQTGTGHEEYGATVRIFDADIDAWRSTWIGPVRGVVMPFLGRKVGDEIILEGSFKPGVSTRWIFFEITPVSFHWRALESGDGWQTHKKLQEMFARRCKPV